jgi:hypothetical protein
MIYLFCYECKLSINNITVLRSRNYLFPLRLRLSKSFSSGNSFGTTCYHRFYIINYIFHVFMKEYRPNSHARSYSIWIFLFLYYFSWPGARSRSRNFDIPPPAPGKSSDSGSTTLQYNIIAHLCDEGGGGGFNSIMFFLPKKQVAVLPPLGTG